MTLDKRFDVPAGGPDLYRDFVRPLGLAEDRWVTAVEFRASAPAVVHHVLYFAHDTGRGRKQAAKAADGRPGGDPIDCKALGGPGGR